MEGIGDEDFVGGPTEVEVALNTGIIRLSGALDVARDAASVAADGFQVDCCGEDFDFFLVCVSAICDNGSGRETHE